MDKLAHIDVGYACFGVQIEDGIVTDAAPIARWMVGKDFKKQVQPWLRHKRAKVLIINCE